MAIDEACVVNKVDGLPELILEEDLSDARGDEDVDEHHQQQRTRVPEGTHEGLTNSQHRQADGDICEQADKQVGEAETEAL